MADLDSVTGARLLKGLTRSDLDELSGLARTSRVDAGETLFRIGTAADTLHIISRGSVELTIPLTVLAVEREVVVTKRTAGDTLGWSALVEPHIFTMGARAETDTELVGFAGSDLQELFSKNPALGCRLLTNLTAVIGQRLNMTKSLWFTELQRSVSEKYG